MLEARVSEERTVKQSVLPAKLRGPTSLLQASAMALNMPSLNLSLPSEPWKNLEEILKRLSSSSTEEQVSLTELPEALDDMLIVPRNRLQHAAITSYGYKLQCLRFQVRRIARERDKARLDLEKMERRCLQLGGELDEQYITLKHTQIKLKAEIEAKELLLQEAVSHQAKMEADTQFLQGKEARLQRRLNNTMKEKTQLQNKVTDMAEKLAASEKLVLELQKELNHVVKDKLGQMEPHSLDPLNQSERFAEIVLEYKRQCQVLWDQNGVLRRELERLHLQLQESRAERGLPAGGLSSEGFSLPVCHSPSHLVPTSACTETSLSMGQLQEQLRDLKVQLETKISCYEEEVELMGKHFVRETKDSEESCKAEMCKMEDRKRDLEETVAKYWAATDTPKEQKHLQSLELEERFEMEQAKAGQQHTEELYHPGQQLDQEGEELRTKCRDRESLRGELCQLLEKSLLKSQRRRLQQDLRLSEEKGSEQKNHVSNLGPEKVEELAEIAELTASSEKSNGEVSHLNVKMHQLGHEQTEHKTGHSTVPDTVQLWTQRLAEAEWLQGVEMATRLENHQQHAACWMEMERLQQQLKTLQKKAGWPEEMKAEWRWLTQECQELWFPIVRLTEEWQDQLFEAKTSLSQAETQHALQLQQAKAEMNNMVPKKQFEQLQTSLREEQCKAQQLQEKLQQQAEQTCRQLVGTQKEHERLLQAAVEQAKGLEHSLRSADAVLADRAAQLKDAQAQLSRNKLLIEDLHEENRRFAVALQAAELKQKSTEEKNMLLEEQALALKQLLGKITPASLSG